MKNYPLVGVNVVGTPVKYGSEVSEFTGHNNYFSVVVSKLDPTLAILTTPKSSYQLKKHTSLNIYQGKCNGRKVHVCLQKIVGKLIHW